MENHTQDYWNEFSTDLVDKVSSLLREAAADVVLPLFRNLQDTDIQTKTGPQDFVTRADIEAEIFLTHELSKLIPHSLVVGEEAVSKEPSVLDRLQSDNWCWILDPVDGTYEFKNGSPKFRMMAALARNGVPYLGWILAPNIEHKDADSQTVLCAAKGRGAWLNEFEQGCKIVLPPENLADADIKGILASADSAKSGPALPLGARTTRGVGAEFDLLLRDPPGTVDWISFDRCHITPWDFAAPYVLVSEAGGIWCQDDSTPYTPNRNNEVRFIAARSERIFNRVQAAFFPEWDPH